MNKTSLLLTQRSLALPLSRRRFIKSLMISWTMTSVMPWQSATAEYDAVSEVWPNWLQHVVGEPIAVIRFGKAYISAHPDENDPDDLLRLIDEALSRLPDIDPNQPLQPIQIAMALKRLVRTEYIDDDILSMEGWILSRTEARLYALAAVLHGS